MTNMTYNIMAMEQDNLFKWMCHACLWKYPTVILICFLHYTPKQLYIWRSLTLFQRYNVDDDYDADDDDDNFDTEEEWQW